MKKVAKRVIAFLLMAVLLFSMAEKTTVRAEDLKKIIKNLENHKNSAPSIRLLRKNGV